MMIIKASHEFKYINKSQENPTQNRLHVDLSDERGVLKMLPTCDIYVTNTGTCKKYNAETGAR